MIKTTTILSIVFIFMGIMTAKSQVKIGFEVSFKEPQAHYAEVQMNIAGLVKDYVDVKMPVWTPGSYLIREFEKSVEGVFRNFFGQSPKGRKSKKKYLADFFS